MKNIHLEMIRVTEAAAIAAAGYVGRGDKEGADGAATAAMRERLNKINFVGKIVIGEGKKDDAPGLFCGEKVGNEEAWTYQKLSAAGYPPYDIAVDPIEGTTPVSKGGYEAVSVMAIANGGCLLETDQFYMNKLVLSEDVALKAKVHIEDPLDETLNSIANALNRPFNRITVCLLDRPRHHNAIAVLRDLGCRIKLIRDCDVTGAIATCMPDSGIDIMYGIGGAPEGVIAAAALKCMGGFIQGQLCDKEGNLVADTIYEANDLVKGDTIFCATGITNGSILKGVRYHRNRPITNSVLMRSESQTIRFIEAHHGN